MPPHGAQREGDQQELPAKRLAHARRERRGGRTRGLLQPLLEAAERIRAGALGRQRAQLAADAADGRGGDALAGLARC